ncbi:MAG: hypothetical protein U0073_02085 [Bacteroidia bacterium]
MSNEHHSTSEKPGIWYTYLGKGGAAVVAFLWILMAMIWIFSAVKWA